MNDCEPVLCFAQQVYGYGKAGDVFFEGISTSGNSKNILYAATTARAIGMKVIGLTGLKIANWIRCAMYVLRFHKQKLIRFKNCIFRFTIACA